MRFGRPTMQAYHFFASVLGVAEDAPVPPFYLRARSLREAHA